VDIKDHSFSFNSKTELFLFNLNYCINSVKEGSSQNERNFDVFFYFENNKIDRKGEFTNFNEHMNVVFTRSGKSYDPSDNLNDQPNNFDNNFENLINFNSNDEDDEPTPQPKTQPPKPVKETPLPKPYKQRSHILNALEKKKWKPSTKYSST
nr:hypothetical protein [Tanacetum cinerariifolium]